MPEIRRAEMNMTGELKRLWQLLYPEDPMEYIDLFFRHRFVPENTAVMVEGDAVIGVMYLLPCALQGGKNGYYAYAGGIRPDFRGKGYFRTLIGEIASVCERENTPLFLVPGPTLWDFYRSMGLRRTFYRKSLTIEPTESGAEVEIIPCTPEEYALRREVLLSPESPAWDVFALDYAAREAEFCGGGMIKVKGAVSGIALVTKREEEILLLETTLTPEEAELCAGAICGRFDAEKLICRFPVSCEAGEREPSGLMLGEGEAPGHLALTLTD